jgi:hypothetical protein
LYFYSAGNPSEAKVWAVSDNGTGTSYAGTISFYGWYYGSGSTTEGYYLFFKISGQNTSVPVEVICNSASYLDWVDGTVVGNPESYADFNEIAITDLTLPPVKKAVGDLADLQTTDKTNLVKAINENHQGLGDKQETLVSGSNIKTINSTSILGGGNVAVQPPLVSGTNIKTINTTSLLGSGNISVGTISAKWIAGDLQDTRYLRISNLGFSAWDALNIQVCDNAGLANIGFRTGTTSYISGGWGISYFGVNNVARFGIYKEASSYKGSLVINFRAQLYNVYVEVRGRNNPIVITFNSSASGEDLGNVDWQA